MKNNFTNVSRDLFIWNDTCWWCEKSSANCLHHILGRSSNSPLNAAPLCNFGCHIGNGVLDTFAIKKQLLKKTLEYLMENHYVLTDEDIEFIRKNQKYYK